MPRIRDVIGQGQDVLTGPFGLWPFPILNVLYQFRSGVTERKSRPEPPTVNSYNVVRDNEGRISSIEVIEGLTGGER